MKQIFEYGNTIILSHNEMTFLVFKSILSKPKIDVIGCYKDKEDIVKRIRRGSDYGVLVLELLVEAPPLELSESQKRLAELIANIGKPMGSMKGE
jgi:hypothetical protein